MGGRVQVGLLFRCSLNACTYFLNSCLLRLYQYFNISRKSTKHFEIHYFRRRGHFGAAKSVGRHHVTQQIFVVLKKKLDYQDFFSVGRAMWPQSTKVTDRRKDSKRTNCERSSQKLLPAYQFFRSLLVHKLIVLLLVFLCRVIPCGESTVVSIVSCRCTYCSPEPIHGKKI